MQSMTGYGKETSRQGDWEMTVELRAVNHRFLDLSMRLGRGLTFLEETIRKTLAPLCRGHVDVQLTLRRISGCDGGCDACRGVHAGGKDATSGDGRGG